jgi:hypothetical protein
MDEPILEIAVGRDRGGWHEKFIDAVEEKRKDLPGLRCSLVNLDRSDWIEQVRDASVILWKPPYMGHEFAGYLKEKIYFLETFEGKLVVPNFASIWHFESKAAQSYLFRHAGVATPGTIVSFDFDEAMELSGKETFPVVLKSPAGAGSVNVSALDGERDLQRFLRKTFSLALWDRTVSDGGKLKRFLKGIRHEWFRDFLARKLRHSGLFGVAYWQEFIHGNPADLRITVIGDRFATGFWRKNRPGDFRASGSGRLDFETPLPEEAIRRCIDISRRLDFDSMAYDILFRDGTMLVSEMSYGYSDDAVHRVSGYSVLDDDGTLRFVEGNTWPQKLWVDWALERAGRRGKVSRSPGAGSQGPDRSERAFP